MENVLHMKKARPGEFEPLPCETEAGKPLVKALKGFIAYHMELAQGA